MKTPLFKDFVKDSLAELRGVLKSPKVSLGKKKTVQSSLGIEITESLIKILAVQGGRVHAVHSEDIHGLSDVEAAQKILSFLQSKGFQPKKVYLSHPTYNLTTRLLSLPSLDPKEIADMVDLQAVKQTPHSREEVTSGFNVLDQDASGYSRVFVAITHRDAPSRYFKIAEMAGLHPDSVGLSVQGIQAWYSAADDHAQTKGESVLILDVDQDATELLIVSGGNVFLNRSLSTGARHLDGQVQAREEEFVREIQRTVESGMAELKIDPVSRVVLTGADAPLRDFSALIVREMNLPCRIVPVFSDAFKTPGSPELSGASFASLIGACLFPKTMSISLIPPDVRMRRALEARARDMAAMATLFLAFVMTLSLVAVEKIVRRNSYLSSLQKEYARIESEAVGVERMVAKMKLASDEMRGAAGVLDVVRDVTEVTPDNIRMTSLEFNSKDRSLLLRGVSDQMSSVFQFLTTLEGTPTLESVKTRNVSKRKAEEKELAEFEIAAFIRSPGTGGL